MNRQIICSLLSTFTGTFSPPASANDNAIVAESHADASARGLAVYYLDRGVASVIRVRRPKSRQNIFVPAPGHAARPLPVLRLLIARPR